MLTILVSHQYSFPPVKSSSYLTDYCSDAAEDVKCAHLLVLLQENYFSETFVYNEETYRTLGLNHWVV